MTCSNNIPKDSYVWLTEERKRLGRMTRQLLISFIAMCAMFMLITVLSYCALHCNLTHSIYLVLFYCTYIVLVTMAILYFRASWVMRSLHKCLYKAFVPQIDYLPVMLAVLSIWEIFMSLWLTWLVYPMQEVLLSFVPYCVASAVAIMQQVQLTPFPINLMDCVFGFTLFITIRITLLLIRILRFQIARTQLSMARSR